MLSASSNDPFLCFGGRFRLSGMRRVAAGARPASLAFRRATWPTSKIFFLRFFMTDRTPLKRGGYTRVLLALAPRRRQLSSGWLARQDSRFPDKMRRSEGERDLQIDAPVCGVRVVHRAGGGIRLTEERRT